MQRVLKQVFCRTKSISESASLAEFLFKDSMNDFDATENVSDSEIVNSNVATDSGAPKIYYNKNSKGTRKLKVVQVMQQAIKDYVERNREAGVSYKDFSHASVAIIREARQMPDANNLQKRHYFKLSPLGPNPNGQHTVMAKK